MAYAFFGDVTSGAGRSLFMPVANWFAAAMYARGEKHVLRALMEMDEHRLQDLGLARADIRQALHAGGTGTLHRYRCFASGKSPVGRYLKPRCRYP